MKSSKYFQFDKLFSNKELRQRCFDTRKAQGLVPFTRTPVQSPFVHEIRWIAKSELLHSRGSELIRLSSASFGENSILSQRRWCYFRDKSAFLDLQYTEHRFDTATLSGMNQRHGKGRDSPTLQGTTQGQPTLDIHGYYTMQFVDWQNLDDQSIYLWLGAWQVREVFEVVPNNYPWKKVPPELQV